MSANQDPVRQQSTGEIVKQGYLKKRKTKKMKYFVLREESNSMPACLEYYDSEKKFKANQPPKRVITLKTCFNINKTVTKKNDNHYKYNISLYTKSDCFNIGLRSEEEMEDWLKNIMQLLGEPIPEGEPVRPNYGLESNKLEQHCWDVNVQPKELGGKKNVTGSCVLCLSEQTLSLLRNDEVKMMIPLQKIRRCGCLDNFFYLELGQNPNIGAGNLWMTLVDKNIADNMNGTIKSAMKNCTKKDILPKSRTRSNSANESSKSTSLLQRFHPGGGGSGGNHQRTYSFPLSPVPPTRRASTGTRPSKHISSHLWMASSRERSDSMPSRHRTTSENTHIPPNHPAGLIRPHSMYNKAGTNYSPPVISSPVSPASGAYSTDSAESSLSMDGDVPDGQWEESGRYSLTPDEPVILEEDYAPWSGEDEKLNNYMAMDSSRSIQSNLPMNRKFSSNLVGSDLKSSSPSQGSGLDIYSPYSSSPLDINTSNYLPMSPGDCRLKIAPAARNLTEEGYVPMAPIATDDGYVDMDQGNYQNIQISGSPGSITSGTPSTDKRFADYTLDKVSSFFSPSELENTPDIVTDERPLRAYSVGSRPGTNVNRSELLNSTNAFERVRAFSVGSRNVRGQGRIPPTSSHSSMEPPEDMMELDFSKKARRARKKVNSSERLSVPGSSASTLSSAASSYSTAEGSYMDMSPPKRFFGKSPPKSSPPGHSSLPLSRVPEGGEGYMEMRPADPKHVVPTNLKARVDLFPNTAPPIKPLLLSNNREDYMDMSLKRKTSLTEDNNNAKVVVPQPDDYVEMTLGNKSEQDNSYMVMNMGNKDKRSHRRGSQPIAIKGAKDNSSMFSLTGGRKLSATTPPKAPLHLSLSNSSRWSVKSSGSLSSGISVTSRDEQSIFPFSPEENEPSPKCPVDATSGEMRIDDEKVDDNSHSIDRLLAGLGIVSASEEDLAGASSRREELYYASLDLVKSGSESEESCRTVRATTESSSSPSPSILVDPSPFNYAEIDFAKSAKKSQN